jgi:hypothetical protein
MVNYIVYEYTKNCIIYLNKYAMDFLLLYFTLLNIVLNYKIIIN